MARSTIGWNEKLGRLLWQPLAKPAKTISTASKRKWSKRRRVIEGIRKKRGNKVGVGLYED
ncbi:hypothetical protein GCM10022409_09660 [Hymenobacter glaciei]|uniref:Uncharacterized protein n=1 Tax=Hymenobacter glaciei TaxID=877209 RepID=A0ABP7TKP1_9BACT